MKTGTRQEAIGNSAKLKVLWVALSAMLFALCSSAEAQQPGKARRIGFLVDGSQPAFTVWTEAFRQGLRELGYMEGQNIVIEYRYADEKTDRLPDLAAELIGLKVSVLVATGTRSIEAAQRATKTIPIVFPITADPVQSGFINSFARPGGNITGLSNIVADIGGKRLELLKEIVPRASRVAAMLNPTNSGSQLELKETQVAARRLGVQLQPAEVSDPNAFKDVFATMTRDGVRALTVLGDAVFYSQRSRIAELTAKSRLPTMYPQSGFVDAGGLMSYGANFADLFRRAATYVDKILKGSKPADLPVERPTKLELIINLKAANQIGLTIPQSVLYRADKLIK